MCSSANRRYEISKNSKISKIKICYWNIHGTKSKIIPDKLSDREFLEKLENSDIVALSEPHTHDTDIAIPGYKLMHQKIREKKHKGPKISGGLAIFAKDYLFNSVHVIPNTNENSIWIKLKHKSCKNNEEFYLGTFYLSPDITRNKDKKANNRNKIKIDLFETLNEEINRFKNKGTILVQGDLNARTGQNEDFLRHDKFDEDFGFENHYNLPTRNSQDFTANTRGNELLDFCKANDYVIVNGRKIGDIFGKYTSHQWNGSSVVDYLITSNTDYNKIHNFTVGEYIPWLSDHCPIYTEINLNIPKQTDANDAVKLHDKEPGYTWNDNHRDTFLTKLNTDAIKHELENLSNAKGTDPIQLVECIKDTIIEAAKNVN